MQEHSAQEPPQAMNETTGHHLAEETPTPPPAVHITPKPIDKSPILLTPNPIDNSPILTTSNPADKSPVLTTPNPVDKSPILPTPKPVDKSPILPTPKPADKTPVVPLVPVTVAPSPWLTMPSFTKTPPNDLYRRLLPAVLFVLTFVTVMTILLIYMDTVAVGAQQFRVNMTRDYELARIGQASAALVAYVRQLHLAPRAPPRAPPPAVPTPQVRVLDALYGEIYNATFVEFLPSGPRSPSTLYLEAARGWDGAVVRAAPRDFLALRGATRALHACLSPADHPREVMYQESPDGGSGLFRSRVLCLPLYTVLLAAAATRARLLLLAGDNALPALTHLPYGDGDLHVQNIEIMFTDPVVRNKTTEFLMSKNYTVAATFDDSVMYALRGDLNNV